MQRVARTHCKHGHPLDEASIICVGIRRQCRACWILRQIEIIAARKLRETRWLNAPPIEVAPMSAYRSGSRPKPWTEIERTEHGPRRRRFDAWVRSFEERWKEPKCWQEILRHQRPTPAGDEGQGRPRPGRRLV